MDFGLTWEQEALLKELDEFCVRELEPVVDEYDRGKALRDPEVAKGFLRRLVPFGVIGGPAPEEYGGTGIDYLTTGMMLRKIAEYWPSLYGVCMIQVCGSRLLSEVDNDRLKETYLPEICAGNLIGCMCITEPDVGSNPTAVTTTLTPVEGGYVVNGTKTWISNGSISDVAVVLATVDRSLGLNGLAMAAVDRRESPFGVRELEKLGLRAFPTSELFFEDCFVPEENVIVKPGLGLKVTMRTFEMARSMMATGAVGFARGAIRIAVDYARQREQFGRPIGSFQLIQEKIADMRARTDAAELLTCRALWMMDQGMRCGAESSLAKYYATEAAVQTTSEAIQVLGAYGLSEEYPAERFFRDARSWTIPDGTTDIQKMIVAREMLGGLQAFF